ncbi:MAG: HAMP domain-containing histidine kinase [Candidatus Obscuribacterales bacterium]|nr:HAMP domain-containing histidine kinase [Candidatus Obscuribacterales bacterium]
MNIQTKGLLIVALPLMFEVLFVLLLSPLLVRMDQCTKEEQKIRDVLAIGHHMGQALICSQVYGISSSVSADAKDTRMHYLEKYQKDVNELRNLPGIPAEGRQLLKVADRIVKKQDRVFAEWQKSAADPFGLGSRKNILVDFYKMEKLIRPLMSEIERKHDQNLNEIRSLKRSIELFIYAGVILSISLTLILIWFFGQDIIRRLQKLSVNAIALGARLPLAQTIGGHDEIAELDLALRRTNDQIGALESARQALVSTICHDIRTPLSTLNSTFSLLSAGVFRQVDGEEAVLLRTATSDLDQANELVSDLVDIEKMQGENLELLFSDIDLITFIELAVAAVKELEPEAIIKVAQIPDILFAGDKDKLSRTLLNLLKMAVRQSVSGGSVEIACIVEKQLIQLLISFQSLIDFESVDSSLTMSRMVIEQHGGTFSVENDTKEKSIRLFIPYVD